MMHNLVSAAAAYPVGHVGDQRAKLPVLVIGYGVGVGTNLLLAFVSGSLAWLVLACGNAVGDMVSNLYVGLLLEAGYPTLAFGIATGVGTVGVCWMLWLLRQRN